MLFKFIYMFSVFLNWNYLSFTAIVQINHLLGSFIFSYLMFLSLIYKILKDKDSTYYFSVSQIFIWCLNPNMKLINFNKQNIFL